VAVDFGGDEIPFNTVGRSACARGHIQ
jgi:hypothetical protein